MILASAAFRASFAAPRILFVTVTNDVGSDRIVSEFGRLGAACAVLGPADCFAALPRCVSMHVSLPSWPGVWGALATLRRRLAETTHDVRADTVIPLDELAAVSLRTMAADAGTPGALRALLVRSLGQVEGYRAACRRVPLMQVAAQVGVHVPAFADATDAAAVERLRYPLLVKRDHSSGSGGVRTVRDPDGRDRAVSRAILKNRAKAWLGRAAGFRHCSTPVLLQAFVPGDLAMHTVACQDGVVLDGFSLRAVAVHPTKRASTMLGLIDHPEMDEAARRIVAALGCSGFVSFDFILGQDGRAALIEMNPRPIGSMHLGRLFGHDLVGAFMAGAAVRPAPVLAPETVVALFPKELERDAASPCLDRASGIHHDLPRDEPEVLDAYLRHLAVMQPGFRDSCRLWVDAEEPPLCPSRVLVEQAQAA